MEELLLVLKWFGYAALGYYGFILIIILPLYLIRQMFIYFFGKEKVFKFLNDNKEPGSAYYFGTMDNL